GGSALVETIQDERELLGKRPARGTQAEADRLDVLVPAQGQGQAGFGMERPSKGGATLAPRRRREPRPYRPVVGPGERERPSRRNHAEDVLAGQGLEDGWTECAGGQSAEQEGLVACDTVERRGVRVAPGPEDGQEPEVPEDEGDEQGRRKQPGPAHGQGLSGRGHRREP